MTNKLTGSADMFTGNVGLVAIVTACRLTGAPDLFTSGDSFQCLHTSYFVGSSANVCTYDPARTPCAGGTQQPYFASLTLRAVSPGTHTYTAKFMGDAVYESDRKSVV